MYKELWFDSATATSSSSKYLKTDTPLFYFDSSLTRVLSAKVLEVIIPQTYYNFVPYPTTLKSGVPVDTVRSNGTTEYAPHGHQAWKLIGYNTQNSNTMVINIPTGGGSAAEFVAFMTTKFFGTAFGTFATAFNTCTGLTATSASVVYNSGAETLDWTINITTNVGTTPRFGIKFVNSSLGYGLPFEAKSLGFEAAENPFTSNGTQLKFTSGFCNANPYSYMTLHSKALGSFFNINPNSNVEPNVYNYAEQSIGDSVSIIPLDGNYRSVVTWRDPDPDNKFTEIKSVIEKVDFYLTLGPYTNEPVNLNGQCFQVKMGLEFDDDVSSSLKRMRTN